MCGARRPRAVSAPGGSREHAVGKQIALVAASPRRTWESRWREEVVNYWNAFLAQRSFGATALTGASGYEFPVVSSEYPRNDSLLAEVAERDRLEVRERLGVRPEQCLARTISGRENR